MDWIHFVRKIDNSHQNAVLLPLFILCQIEINTQSNEIYQLTGWVSSFLLDIDHKWETAYSSLRAQLGGPSDSFISAILDEHEVFSHVEGTSGDVLVVFVVIEDKNALLLQFVHDFDHKQKELDEN